MTGILTNTYSSFFLKSFFSAVLFLLTFSSFAQNMGVGTAAPSHTLHVKPKSNNPNPDPVRFEGLQGFRAAGDSVIIVANPDSGILRMMHIDSLIATHVRTFFNSNGKLNGNRSLDLDGNKLQFLNGSVEVEDTLTLTGYGDGLMMSEPSYLLAVESTGEVVEVTPESLSPWTEEADSIYYLTSAAAAGDTIMVKGGKLGIGTADPQESLDVNGGLIANSATVSNFGGLSGAEITAEGTSGAIIFQIGNDNLSKGESASISSNASSPLIIEAQGPSGAVSTGSTVGQIQFESSGDIALKNASSITENPEPSMFIEGGTGNIGINTLEPVAKLSVNGGILVTDTVTLSGYGAGAIESSGDAVTLGVEANGRLVEKKSVELLVHDSAFPSTLVESMSGATTDQEIESWTITLTAPALVHVNYSCPVGSVRNANDTYITDGATRMIGAFLELNNEGRYASSKMPFTESNSGGSFGFFYFSGSHYFDLGPGTYTISLHGQVYGNFYSIEGTFGGGISEHLQITAHYK